LRVTNPPSGLKSAMAKIKADFLGSFYGAELEAL